MLTVTFFMFYEIRKSFTRFFQCGNKLTARMRDGEERLPRVPVGDEAEVDAGGLHVEQWKLQLQD